MTAVHPTHCIALFARVARGEIGGGYDDPSDVDLEFVAAAKSEFDMLKARAEKAEALLREILELEEPPFCVLHVNIPNCLGCRVQALLDEVKS